jgi:hypothetical protein
LKNLSADDFVHSVLLHTQPGDEPSPGLQHALGGIT